MAKLTADSIFDNKDRLNKAIEQFKSLFIEVQQIIISKQFKNIPQYLSKLEHFNQQYAEIYQRKSEISSSITHFHNFNEAIINLYLPQLPEQLASLSPIDNFFALLEQAQDIIKNKKFDLAEQYLSQVKIFREQHGELIKFIFRSHDPLALNAFNDFTDFIQQYPSLLECSASNDNLIVNDISAHLKEKIIMIEAKGLRKSKKLSVIKTLDQSEHIDNPQGKIDHVELLSEKSANEQITEPQILDINNHTNIQVVTEPTIGNKIHIITSPTHQELDLENNVDWFIEPEKLDATTDVISSNESIYATNNLISVTHNEIPLVAEHIN